MRVIELSLLVALFCTGRTGKSRAVTAASTTTSTTPWTTLTPLDGSNTTMLNMTWSTSVWPSSRTTPTYAAHTSTVSEKVQTALTTSTGTGGAGNTDDTTDQAETTPPMTPNMTTTLQERVCLTGSCTGENCLRNITTTCPLEEDIFCYQTHEYQGEGEMRSYMYEVGCRESCQSMTTTRGEDPATVTMETSCCQDNMCNKNVLIDGDPPSGVGVVAPSTPLLAMATTSAVVMVTTSVVAMVTTGPLFITLVL